MRVTVIPASSTHIAHIADNMRQGDVDEFLLLGMSPEFAITMSLKGCDQAWTGMIDDVPVCMFGVSPSNALTPSRGVPWMMGTKDLDLHALTFLRRCRTYVQKMNQMYPVLDNWVASSNKSAIMWLEWMGFTIHPSTDQFIRFTMEREMTLPATDFVNLVTAAEKKLLNMPQLNLEPIHRFAEGLYCRELTMPGGSLVVSRVHKHENFAVILRGECIVAHEGGNSKYVAGQILKTMPGTKRILFMPYECTWATFHAKPEELGEDIDAIEEYFACDTYEDYQQFLIGNQGVIE